jgi:type II secretory pathway component GspD/PulD (secretin)
MKRKVCSPIIAAVALASVLTAPTAAAFDDVMDKRISLNLKDAQLQKIFDMYKGILDVELEIDPTLDEKVTIAFEKITVRTSLNAICESAGCLWELIDGAPGLLRVTRDELARHRSPQPGEGEMKMKVFASHAPEKAGYNIDSDVSLRLTDADATTVLDVAAEVIGASLLMDRRLAGETVTINASAVPLSSVLDTMCAELGCAWKLTDGDPPMLEVYYP